MIDSDSVIIKPDVAEAHRPKPSTEATEPSGAPYPPADGPEPGPDTKVGKTEKPVVEKLPIRFVGTVMISAERPAREIHQVVEAIIEQLTTIQGSEVTLKLEIDADVPSGLDRAKVRTLIENATTLGFIDKSIS